jgi:hypothetical protein
MAQACGRLFVRRGDIRDGRSIIGQTPDKQIDYPDSSPDIATRN